MHVTGASGQLQVDMNVVLPSVSNTTQTSNTNVNPLQEHVRASATPKYVNLRKKKKSVHTIVASVGDWFKSQAAFFLLYF